MEIKMLLPKIQNKIRRSMRNESYCRVISYLEQYERYSFNGNKCIDDKQYEAVITRWYHTIEKGLSYINFRKGFGRNNIDELLTSMENYIADGYSQESFFYKTALSTLHMYIKKNKEYGYENTEINDRVNRLPGTPNGCGGTITPDHYDEEELHSLGYADFVKSRHSMRHFSDRPLCMNKVEEVFRIAQLTPSACNRQGWQARIVLNKSLLEEVRKCQSGNKGFGEEFQGLIVVTGDVRCFNHDRELFQPFIDGGMYCQSILNALHYEHIASIPLSAALMEEQEKKVRQLLAIQDAEVLIMFIGIGNYPDNQLTARSERKKATPIFYK